MKNNMRQEPSASVADGIQQIKTFLAAGREAAQQTDGERFDFSPKFAAVFTALEGAVRVMAQTFTAYERAAGLERGVRDQLAKERTAAKTKGLDPAGKEAVFRLEQNRTFAELKVRIATDKRDAANAAAEKCVEAMKGVTDAIAAAQLELRMPSSLRAKGDLASLLARDEQRTEIRSTILLKGVREFAQLYDDARRIDPEKANELRDLAKPVLDDLLTGELAKAGKRHRPQRMAEDQSQALSLLYRFAAEEKADRPPELEAAILMRDQLELVMRKLVGQDWSLAGGKSPGEFMRALNAGTLSKNGFLVDPDWPVRYLPPTNATLILPLGWPSINRTFPAKLGGE